MTLLRLPTEDAQLHVRVSLDVEIQRRRVAAVASRMSPIATLDALLGDARDAQDGATLRRIFVELAAVAQHAAAQLDREADHG